jgi:hypothetical protein
MNEVEIPLKITGIGAIKAELRELKGAIADATDPEQIAQLSQRAGELKDKLSDANEAVNNFATGSKFEQVSNSLSGIKDSLLSLDFAEAQQKAQVFASALGSVNPKEIAAGFKNFTGVIKTMGGAFVKLGVQILANPIFLLVGVIVAIVAAIVIFLNKIGVLEKVLSVLMAPINALINGFKALTDWLGLTDNAAEENAEAVKAASESNIKAIEKEMEARKGLYDVTKDLSLEEISAIEDQLGVEIDRYATLEELQIEEERRKQQQRQDQIEAMGELADMDEEQTKEYLKLKDDEAAAILKINQLAIQQANNRKKLAQDINHQIEMLNVKQIKNETERSKAILKIQEAEAIAKLKRQRREASRLDDWETVANIDKLILLTQKDFEQQRTELTTASNKKRVEDNKQANAKIESAQDKHLKAMRAQFKIDLDKAVIDGKTKLEIDQMKIDQMVKESKELEKLNIKKTKIFATEMDRATAVSAMNAQIKQAIDQLEADKIAIADKDAVSRIKTLMLEEQDATKKLEIQKQLIEEERKQAVTGKDLTEQQIKEINAKAVEDTKAITNQLIAIENDKNAKILAAAKLVQETKMSQEQFNLDRFKGTAEQQITAQQSFLATELATLDLQQTAELAALDLSEAEKEAIREKYRQARIVAEETTKEKIIDIEEQANAKIFNMIDQGFETAKQAANAIASVNAIGIGKKLKDVEKGSKEEEKLLKKQFEQQKAFNLAMAAINGAQAILAILSVPDFTLGIASGIRIAASVAATAASIAAITSTSFEGGGSAPNPDTAGSSSAVNNSLQMATPNLFGNNNNANNVGGANQNNDQSTPNFTVTAVVSETEMTSTQNRVNRIQRNAEL